MTSTIDFVYPDTPMTQVAKLFDVRSYHHLPVLSEEGAPLGVLSRHDFHRVQHHFTHLGWQNLKKENEYFLDHLLTREVMSADPKTLDVDDPIKKALDVFLENKVHSILVCSHGQCVGIITPFDILKYTSEELM